MRTRSRTFLFLNTKQKTLIQFTATMDGLGRTTWTDRVDFIVHGECAKYANPWQHFILHAADIIQKYPELELMENKLLEEAEENLARLQAY